ncbi:MAG: PP2C-family Ser/Thr phosphatase, partial [Actinomycetota bacterium]
ALAWLDDEIAIVHVGDSRAYLLRDGALAQLTKDDTYVQTLVDSGRITADEAFTHERRNLLTQALDGVHSVEPEFSVRPAHAGDRYMLCSDGLCGVVPEDRLREILSLQADPTGIVDALVEEALAHGAPDNVTVVVADVIEVDPADAASHPRPTVVGAAFEQRNRERLPEVAFPADRQPELLGAGESPTVAADGLALPPRNAPLGTMPQAPAESGDDSGGRRSGPRHAAPSRSLWPRLAAVAAILAVALGAFLGWQWMRGQYFVGDLNGNVAVFQGIPLGFGDHGFSTVEQESATKTAALPEYERSRVDQTIPAATAAEALSIMNKLEAAAQSCASAKPPTGCPQQPTPSASPSASPPATASATPATSSPAASSAAAPAPAATAAPAAAGTP